MITQLLVILLALLFQLEAFKVIGAISIMFLSLETEGHSCIYASSQMHLDALKMKIITLFVLFM